MLAESWQELLGTRRFILGSVLGVIALYYYFFVYHAVPVLATTTQSESELDAPAPLFHDVIALENVLSTAARIKLHDPRAPTSAADPAPTIDDIMQHLPVSGRRENHRARMVVCLVLTPFRIVSALVTLAVCSVPVCRLFPVFLRVT